MGGSLLSFAASAHRQPPRRFGNPGDRARRQEDFRTPPEDLLLLDPNRRAPDLGGVNLRFRQAKVLSSQGQCPRSTWYFEFDPYLGNGLLRGGDLHPGDGDRSEERRVGKECR